MVRSFLALCAALSLCVASVASAQATKTPVVYVAIDSVGLQLTELTITGVVQGEQAATTKVFVFSSGTESTVDACHRIALLAMMKPGQYLFRIVPEYSAPDCKLSRVTP